MWINIIFHYDDDQQAFYKSHYQTLKNNSTNVQMIIIFIRKSKHFDEKETTKLFHNKMNEILLMLTVGNACIKHIHK